MVKTVHGKNPLIQLRMNINQTIRHGVRWTIYVRTECVNHTPDGAEKKRFQHEYFWSWGYALCQSGEIKIWSTHEYHSSVRSRCIIYVDNTIIHNINYTIRIRQRNTMIIYSTAGDNYDSNDNNIILYYKSTLSACY